MPALQAYGGEHLETVDCYRLLGVSPFSSKDAIRKAFHSRLFQLHPDLNPSDSLAVDRTRDLIEAYRILVSSEVRPAAPLWSDPTLTPACPDTPPVGFSQVVAKTLGATLLLVAMALALSVGISFGFGEELLGIRPDFAGFAQHSPPRTIVLMAPDANVSSPRQGEWQYETKMDEWPSRTPAYAPAEAFQRPAEVAYTGRTYSYEPVVTEASGL